MELEKNEDKIKEISKKWREVNKEHMREYRFKNKFKIKATAKRAYYRRRTDEIYVLKYRLRNRLTGAFNRFSKTGKIATSKEYGIDYQAIIEHLGPCPGDRCDFHIDHIQPLSSFDFNDPKQIKEAFVPENHQWLTIQENLTKSAKIETVK